VSATTDLVSETRPSPTAGASYFSTVILFGRANKPGNALSSFCDRIAPLLILDQQLINSSPSKQPDVTSILGALLRILCKISEGLVLKRLT
jgi:hypothetical protein